MKTGKLTIVDWAAGDWRALYIDGILAMEGHSLDADDVLKALGVAVESRRLPDDYHGWAPPSLEELPL